MLLMRLLAIDPSITRTGYALMERSGDVGAVMLADCGYITPHVPKAAMPDRATSIADQLYLMFWADDVRFGGAIIIETPSGHVGARHRGRGAGLSTYGFAVGVIYERLREAMFNVRTSTDDAARVECVDENTWTGGSTKAHRLAWVMAEFPRFAKGLREADSGGDVVDAIALGLWWYQRQRMIRKGVG